MTDKNLHFNTMIEEPKEIFRVAPTLSFFCTKTKHSSEIKSSREVFI